MNINPMFPYFQQLGPQLTVSLGQGIVDEQYIACADPEGGGGAGGPDLLCKITKI